MDFNDIKIPEDVNYDKNHMWVRKDGELYTIGWTDYAQLTAGDVVFLELKKEGEQLQANDEFGSIETGKWVGKFYVPVEGEVVETNEKVINEAELVNSSPYDDGWLIKIKPTSSQDPPSLLSADDYKKLIESEGGL